MAAPPTEPGPVAPVSEALASMLSGCAAARVWAEQDEGPYHRDTRPLRRTIVEDRDGVELQLGIRLAHVGDIPVQDAIVEIWQCDAIGRYSGFPPPDDAAATTGAHASHGDDLAGQTFLRGGQRTDEAGMVEFRTIYPGWYPGRTVHIHVMVHRGVDTFTSQLYFPEAVSERVLTLAPYARRPGRDTTNDTDEIFPTGGDPALLDVVTVADGYRGAICLVLPEDRAPARSG